MMSPPDPKASTHRFDDGVAYERFMGKWSRAAGAVFLDWLSPPTGARWLDVGCGTDVFTGMVVDRCSPASVHAIDPAEAQIDHALRRPIAARASFRVGDARDLPFTDASFDVVASALVINFIPDAVRALSEMRRVTRAGGLVAGYVWDFASECSPSWPLREAMHRMGSDAPAVPGTDASRTDALVAAFQQVGLEQISTTIIEVSASYADFDDFWDAQTPSYSPTTWAITAMTASDRARLVEIVRASLAARPDGTITYSARANAIRASVPG